MLKCVCKETAVRTRENTHTDTLTLRHNSKANSTNIMAKSEATKTNSMETRNQKNEIENENEIPKSKA